MLFAIFGKVSKMQMTTDKYATSGTEETGLPEN